MALMYEHDIQACVSVLNEHGVILYPTDTIWGLGCKADDEEAIEKIYAIKQRPKEQTFILLMTDLKQLSRYIANPLPNLDEILANFTEPTTFIYPNAINLPHSLLSADGSIGIRITKDPFCRSLIKRIQQPLVSTSANPSGQTSAATFSMVNDAIKASADYIVTWRQDDQQLAQPSAIYKINSQAELIRIR